MSPVRLFKLPGRGWGLTHYFHQVTALQVGDRVRVCKLLSPLAGRSGTVVEAASADTYGPYLVQFDEGLRFRYRRQELTVLTSSSDSAIEQS